MTKITNEYKCPVCGSTAFAFDGHKPSKTALKGFHELTEEDMVDDYICLNCGAELIVKGKKDE